LYILIGPYQTTPHKNALLPGQSLGFAPETRSLYTVFLNLNNTNSDCRDYNYGVYLKANAESTFMTIHKKKALFPLSLAG